MSRQKITKALKIICEKKDHTCAKNVESEETYCSLTYTVENQTKKNIILVPNTS